MEQNTIEERDTITQMIMKQQSLALFENQGVRRVWDELREEWYFSVIDVVAVLAGSKEPRRYWSDLKIKL